MCQSLFFNKATGLRPATLLKKRLWHRCFSVNFAKFLKHLFYRTRLDDWFFYSSSFLREVNSLPWTVARYFSLYSEILQEVFSKIFSSGAARRGIICQWNNLLVPLAYDPKGSWSRLYNDTSIYTNNKIFSWNLENFFGKLRAKKKIKISKISQESKEVNTMSFKTYGSVLQNGLDFCHVKSLLRVNIQKHKYMRFSAVIAR